MTTTDLKFVAGADLQSTLTRVQIDKVVVLEGRRLLDEVNVQRLMASMKLIGLRQPINVLHDDGNPGTYRLIAGRHRLEAARQLGWRDIPAMYLVGDTVAATEIAEIIENLHRQDLSAPERAIAIERLKMLEGRVNSERIEEVRHGNAEEKASAFKRKRGGNAGISGKKPGSSRAIAEQFGIDQKTVLKSLKQAEALGAAMLHRIAKLEQFDKPSAVDALVGMDVETREKTVAAAERGEDVAPRASNKAALTPFDIVAKHLPKLSADERDQVRRLLDGAHPEGDRLQAAAYNSHAPSPPASLIGSFVHADALHFVATEDILFACFEQPTPDMLAGRSHVRSEIAAAAEAAGGRRDRRRGKRGFYGVRHVPPPSKS